MEDEGNKIIRNDSTARLQNTVVNPGATRGNLKVARL
jgi:hypothetical protein